VERNGIEVVASAPGKIIWLGPDPNGGWGVDILTDIDGLAVGEFHLKPVEGLKEGLRVERNQLIGWVEFPPGPPHIHLDIKQYRRNGLYFMDTYSPSFKDGCIEYLLLSQGKAEPIKGGCSPGYWIVTNTPTYP